MAVARSTPTRDRQGRTIARTTPTKDRQGKIVARTKALLLPALLLALPTACGDRESWVTERPSLQGPVALGHGLFYVERTRGELLAVDVLATDPADHVVRYDLGERPGLPVVVPPPDSVSAPSALAVLSPSDRQLHLFSEDTATGALSRRVLDLEQAYDRIQFSPDGTWGLAWMGAAAEQADFITLTGKVAIIDVATALSGGEEPVAERALHLEAAPTKVVFSRPLPLFDGESAMLAAVVTPNRIAVVDLAQSARRSRTIFLDPGVRPRSMRFTDGLAADAEAEFLLFNADGDAGISAYRILGVAAESEDEPRIHLTYHQLLPDDPPADFAVFPGPSNRRYMLVSVGSGRQRATVMESLTTPVGTPVELAAGAVNRVVRAQLSTGENVALLYQDRGGTAHLQVLRLGAGTDSRPEVSATEAFVAAVSQVHTITGQPGVALVFLHDEAQLELVDIGTTRSTPVRLRSRPLNMVWDQRGSELYLAVSDGARGEGNLLVRVRLEGGQLVSESLVLDAAPSAVYLLEQRGVAVVDHGQAHGLLTAVDVTDMKRSKARVLEGIFLTGLFDAAGGR